MPCFPNTTDKRAFGIDVAKYNPVHWDACATLGNPMVSYCMIRWGQAHQGAYDDIDPRLFINWGGAVVNHIPRMGYHVIYPGSEVVPQVANVKRIASLLGNDMGDPIYAIDDEPILWIDLELDHGQTGKTIIDKTYGMKIGIEDALGIEVGIYTGSWFLSKFKVPAQAWWRETYWWLAQYGVDKECPYPLVVPQGIPPHMVVYHQTTSKVHGWLLGCFHNTVDGNRELQWDVAEEPDLGIMWQGKVFANALTVWDSHKKTKVVRYLAKNDIVDVYQLVDSYAQIAVGEWVNSAWLEIVD